MNILKTQVNSCFQSVSRGTSLLASTITGLEVQAAADATFETLNSNIQQLATNKYNAGISIGKSQAQPKVISCTLQKDGGALSSQYVQYIGPGYTKVIFAPTYITPHVGISADTAPGIGCSYDGNYVYYWVRTDTSHHYNVENGYLICW